MAEKTEIAWTDSTFNPWWGCSKVGPGCDHCYAEALDRRTGGDHWGPDKTPRVMSGDNWRKPVRWQRIAEASGTRRRVFCGSMCDWADKNAPAEHRDKLWELIRATPALDWQLLTKRAIDELRIRPQHAVQIDGSCAHCPFSFLLVIRHGPRLIQKVAAKADFKIGRFFRLTVARRYFHALSP